MEFEIYESELADYSLQDSPFYEATPIIFGLSNNSTSVFGSNRFASMDALNLSAKKSSMMISTKNQSLKTSFERSTNGNTIGKSIDTHSNLSNAGLIASKKCFEIDDRCFNDKKMAMDKNRSDSTIQPKKKRKCVSFLPNYVQVCIYRKYCFIFFFFKFLYI